MSNFAFVGADGENCYFVKNGFAYYSRSRFSKQYPMAVYNRMYSVAHHVYGSDHLRAEHLTDVHYQELNDVHLYPNQRVAWTVLDSEA